MKLLILGGGASPEREVSLRSATAVADAARQADYEVEEADPGAGLMFLDKLQPGTIVLPILHGAGGEDGSLQAELEKRNLPFLGTKSQPSTACWDKWTALNKLAAAGVPIAKSELVTPYSFKHHALASKPYVLKVRRGGSSIGVLIARDTSRVRDWQIEEVFAMESPAILEELIEGVEITVAVLDGQALPVVEIRPPTNGEFDYDNKYNGKTAELCPPENVSDEVQASARAVAEKSHKLLGCRHLSRTDMMVRPDGSLFVFDLNTMPGLTEQSLYPKAALTAGLSMPELVKKFVAMVERDA